MVICLERGSDLYIAQLMPLPLTASGFSKIHNWFLPFWYRLTWVVPDKGRSTSVTEVRSQTEVNLNYVQVCFKPSLHDALRQAALLKL